MTLLGSSAQKKQQNIDFFLCTRKYNLDFSAPQKKNQRYRSDQSLRKAICKLVCVTVLLFWLLVYIYNSTTTTTIIIMIFKMPL